MSISRATTARAHTTNSSRTTRMRRWNVALAHDFERDRAG
jgi:hypothetical protein